MARRRRSSKTEDVEPRIHAAERMLIDALPDLTASRALCTTRGGGRFAAEFGRANTDAVVVCHTLDVFLADRLRESLAESPNVEVACSADPPEGPFDLVAFPFGKNGEAELARETLQTGYERLAEGGRLVATIDNPRDSWLHDELRKLFPKVTRTPAKDGVLHLATRRGPLKRRREFGCEFAFRDGDRLVHAFSRPGVFSHRRIDTGARALLEAVAVEPGDRVLDIGCGAGVVGLALAGRAEGVRVLAVDPNPRALHCTERGAAMNDLADRIETRLDATATVPDPRSFDLVVGNPPYFSKFAIAEVFVAGAERAVKPGGLVAFVTRQPDWFAERMVDSFADVTVADVRGYSIVAGTGDPPRPNRG